MFNLTRQEQVIGLLLVGGVVVGGVVLWVRGDEAPTNPDAIEFAIDLERHNKKQIEIPDELLGTDAPEDDLIDINTASGVLLQTISGIGPVTAEAIIEYREANGPFISIDELIEVRGIGPKKMEDFRRYFVVEDMEISEP